MKRIYNYIFLSVFAFAAAGCLEDDLNPGGELTGSGDDVQFGLSLNDPSTKTIYGPENDFGFPVYWSEGDKIQIASPQCVDGRRYAEYLVTPQSGQSYALAMTKTGNYGVQWGNSATADFYSIYPSNGTSWTTLESGSVVAKLNISSEQSANLVLTAAEFEKDAEGNTTTTIKTPGWYQAADMKNVIMYAPKTTAKRGEVVKLNYKPYSTILEFELGIAQNKDEEDNLVTGANAWGTVKVVSMTLTAPTGTYIAGDFTLKFNENNAPTIAAAGNSSNSNSIKVVFATQPVLDEENQTLYAKLAMIPVSGITSLDNWKVAIEVLEGTDVTTKTYTKTFSGSGNKTTLVPGKIHKIELPKFSSKLKWEVKPNAWIPTLKDYKNIYLTELSVPGAWYAGAPKDDGYQATADIPTLWQAGIRAFAVECRSATSGLLNNSPSAVVISGSGKNSTGLSGAKWYYGGDKIRTTIKSIADKIAESVVYENGAVVDGEYGVLVLSYADGGEGGRRPQDFQFFINGVKTEIANSGASNIYDKEIDANTTIQDVLGKLIIKINVDDNLTKASYSYADNKGMKALLSYNPFLQQLPNGTDFKTPLFSKMYWSAWEDTYKVTTTNNATDFLWCFSSANRTAADGSDTDIPTYEQRKAALRGMMTHSKELTASKKHNVWFYFNAGGTQTTSQSDKNTSATNFAAEMNGWLYDLVKLKANGGTDTNGVYGTKGAYVESDPSPLGIVMFNQCTGDNATYHGADIINEIIQMNNKATLIRKNGTKAISAAPSYSSGMNDSDVAAFGWD